MPIVPTAASTLVAASEKAEKAAVENLVAEADEAVAAKMEEANAEKAPASKSGSEADDEQASALALSGAALRFGQQFELTTPMLVMPFRVFKAQGRIRSRPRRGARGSTGIFIPTGLRKNGVN